MSDSIQLTAEIRTTVGKGASRRLRRLDNKVPGIIYGGEKEPQKITLHGNQLSGPIPEALKQREREGSLQILQ